jgi:hypothetical protein
LDEPLHPSSLSEILDRTAEIYRSRFPVFFGIAVLPTAMLTLFASVAFLLILRVAPGAGSTSTMAGVFASIAGAVLFLIALPILLAATALANAAMSHAAAQVYLGQPINIRGSYRAVWERGWRFIGLFVFETLVVWVAPFAAWSILLLFSAALAALAQSAGIGSGGLFILSALVAIAGLISYGFWMAIRISLAFPAAVVEQIGSWGALRRSALLTHGSRGRILLLFLLGVALNWTLSMAIMLPLAFLVAFLPGAESPQHAQSSAMFTMAIIYGSAFAVQALTRPVYGIALILFYYDQRIRQEAFDIEWMMLKAGLVVPPPPQPQYQPGFDQPVGEDRQQGEAIDAAGQTAAAPARLAAELGVPEIPSGTPADPIPVDPARHETTPQEKSLESNAPAS